MTFSKPMRQSWRRATITGYCGGEAGPPDEVIELAMLRCSYDATGRIHRVLDVFDRFREPQKAEISDEITRLTRISQDMVKGHAIEPGEVEAFLAGASIVISHNANFDRRACEQHFPIFRRMHWGCSLKEIDWKAEGFTSSRLGDLLATQGLFHSGHRADIDCHALRACLNFRLPSSGKLALAALLGRARLPTTMVVVEYARQAGAFLRRRGFHWHADADGCHKSWRLEMSEFRAQHEVALLQEEFPAARVTTRRVTALTRHSDRA